MVDALLQGSGVNGSSSFFIGIAPANYALKFVSEVEHIGRININKSY